MMAYACGGWLRFHLVMMYRCTSSCGRHAIGCARQLDTRIGARQCEHQKRDDKLRSHQVLSIHARSFLHKKCSRDRPRTHSLRCNSCRFLSAPPLRPETPSPPRQTPPSFRLAARARICRSSPISLPQSPPRSVLLPQLAAICPACPTPPASAS